MKTNPVAVDADVEESLMAKIDTLRADSYKRIINFSSDEKKLLEIIEPNPYPKIAKILSMVMAIKGGRPREYLEILHYTAVLSRGECTFENFLNLNEINQQILIISWWRTILADLDTLLSILKLLNNPRIVLVSRFATADQSQQLIKFHDSIIESQHNIDSHDEKSNLRKIGQVSESFLKLSTIFANEEQNNSDQCSLTMMLLLSSLYGEDLITEILDRSRNDNQPLRAKDVFSCAKNWSELEDFPIQWSLQMGF